MDARPQGRPLRRDEAYELLHKAPRVWPPTDGYPAGANSRAAPLRSSSSLRLTPSSSPVGTAHLQLLPEGQGKTSPARLVKSSSCFFTSHRLLKPEPSPGLEKPKQQAQPASFCASHAGGADAVAAPCSAVTTGAGSHSSGPLPRGAHRVPSSLQSLSVSWCSPPPVALQQQPQPIVSSTMSSWCMQHHWPVHQQQPAKCIHEVGSRPGPICPCCSCPGRGVGLPPWASPHAREQQLPRALYFPLAASACGGPPLCSSATGVGKAGQQQCGTSVQAVESAASNGVPIEGRAGTTASGTRSAAERERCPNAPCGSPSRRTNAGGPAPERSACESDNAVVPPTGLDIKVTRYQPLAENSYTRWPRCSRRSSSSSQTGSISSSKNRASTDVNSVTWDAASAAAVAADAVAAAAFSLALRSQKQLLLQVEPKDWVPAVDGGASAAAAPPTVAYDRDGIYRPELPKGDPLSVHLRETLTMALGSDAGCQPGRQQPAREERTAAAAPQQQQQQQQREAEAALPGIAVSGQRRDQRDTTKHPSSVESTQLSQLQGKQQGQHHELQPPVGVHMVSTRKHRNASLPPLPRPHQAAASAVSSPQPQHQQQRLQHTEVRAHRRRRSQLSQRGQSVAEALQQALHLASTVAAERQQQASVLSTQSYCGNGSSWPSSNVPLAAHRPVAASGDPSTPETPASRSVTAPAAAVDDEEEHKAGPCVFTKDSLCGVSICGDGQMGTTGGWDDAVARRSIFEHRPGWVTGMSMEPRGKRFAVRTPAAAVTATFPAPAAAIATGSERVAMYHVFLWQHLLPQQVATNMSLLLHGRLTPQDKRWSEPVQHQPQQGPATRDRRRMPLKVRQKRAQEHQQQQQALPSPTAAARSTTNGGRTAAAIRRLPRSPLRLGEERQRTHHRPNRCLIEEATAEAATAAEAEEAPRCATWSDEAGKAAWAYPPGEETGGEFTCIAPREREMGSTFSLSRLSYADPGRRQLERHQSHAAAAEPGQHTGKSPMGLRRNGQWQDKMPVEVEGEETAETPDEAARGASEGCSLRSYSDAPSVAEGAAFEEAAPGDCALPAQHRGYSRPYHHYPNRRSRERLRMDATALPALPRRGEWTGREEPSKIDSGGSSCSSIRPSHFHNEPLREGHDSSYAPSWGQQEEASLPSAAPEHAWANISRRRFSRQQEQQWRQQQRAQQWEHHQQWEQPLHWDLQQPQQSYGIPPDQPTAETCSASGCSAANEDASVQQQQQQWLHERQLYKQRARQLARQKAPGSLEREEEGIPCFESQSPSSGAASVAAGTSSPRSAPYTGVSSGRLETVGGWGPSSGSPTQTATAAQETAGGTGTCSDAPPLSHSASPPLYPQQSARKERNGRHHSATRATQTTRAAATKSAAAAALPGGHLPSLVREILRLRVIRGPKQQGRRSHHQEVRHLLNQKQHILRLQQASLQHRLQQHLHQKLLERLGFTQEPIRSVAATVPNPYQAVRQESESGSSPLVHESEASAGSDITEVVPAATAAPTTHAVSRGSSEVGASAMATAPSATADDVPSTETSGSSTAAPIPTELPSGPAQTEASGAAAPPPASPHEMGPCIETPEERPADSGASEVAAVAAETAVGHQESDNAEMNATTATAAELPARLVGWEQIRRSNAQQLQQHWTTHAATAAQRARAAAIRAAAASRAAIRTAWEAAEGAAAPPLRSCSSNLPRRSIPPFPRGASAQLPPVVAHRAATMCHSNSNSNNSSSSGSSSTANISNDTLEKPKVHGAKGQAASTRGVRAACTAAAATVAAEPDTYHAPGAGAKQGQAAEDPGLHGHRKNEERASQDNNCSELRHNDQGSGSAAKDSRSNISSNNNSTPAERQCPQPTTAETQGDTESIVGGMSISVLPTSEGGSSSGDWPCAPGGNYNLPRVLLLQLRRKQQEEKQRMAGINYLQQKQQLLRRLSRRAKAQQAKAQTIAYEKIRRHIASKSPP